MRLLPFALALLPSTPHARITYDIELGLGTDLAARSTAEYFSVGVALDHWWRLSDPDQALAAGGRVRFTTGDPLLPPILSLEGGLRRTWNATGDWPWGFSVGGGPALSLGDDPRFGTTARLGLGWPTIVEISTVGTWLIQPDDTDWRLGLELTVEPDLTTVGSVAADLVLHLVAAAALTGIILLYTAHRG